MSDRSPDQSSPTASDDEASQARESARSGDRTYQTIVADPPWPQKGGGSLKGREGFLDAGGRSLDLPYPTMTVADIAALRIPASVDSHLYLWTTSGFLPSAFAVLEAWGFTYSTTLVWAKAPIGHGLGGAYGIATEFVLFARRGSLPALSKVGRNWFDWKRPYDERGKPRHSAKPPEFYAMVEQVSPGPYLEMFARDFRLGWDAWGDEAPNAITLRCCDRPAAAHDGAWAFGHAFRGPSTHSTPFPP